MRELFKISLPVEGSAVEHAVHFQEDVYLFESQGHTTSPLRIYREHDEWKSETAIEDSTFRAATEALDSYLLSQH